MKRPENDQQCKAEVIPAAKKSQEEDRDNNLGHMRRESQWEELYMVQESSTMLTHSRFSSSSLVALMMPLAQLQSKNPMRK